MIQNDSLNILGFCPETLNILLEHVYESHGVNNFRVFKNVPESVNTHLYIPQIPYEVSFYDISKTVENDFALFDNKDEKFIIGVVGIKSKEIVFDWFINRFNLKKEQFINLVHPDSYVSGSASINQGFYLGIYSTINVLSKIGFGVTIKNNSYIGHHVKIGDFTTINPGVTVSSSVEIGNNTLIGSGAVIRDGVKIGDNSIIGMGSCVVKDIPSNSVAFGNPCKVVKNLS